jgi:hypothetical protein
MRVTAVTNGYVVDSSSSVEQVRDNLQKLADQHNTTVDALVSGAKAAGSAGLPYQIRALNLQTRIDKMEDK